MAQSVAGARPTTGTLIAAVRSAGERPMLVVGALFLVAAGLTAYYATKITTYQPDELGYTHMAMAIGDSPGLWTSAHGGGDRLNQLYPLILAPIYRLWDNVTAYHVAHWLNAGLMASTVIPVYLLSRGVLERRGAAYLATAVAAIVPWLTLSSGELTEVVAYPACAWALFAMHRALTRPSWRADLWALVAILVATYGRLQLGILGPAFIAAVLLHEVGWALTGGTAASGRAAALREARRRLLRDHIVLAAATGAALAVLAVLLVTGKLQAAFGYYGNTIAGDLFPPGMWSNARANVTSLAWGAGVLPLVVSAGLVLESLVAPRARRVHAFAILALLVFVGILLSVARINASLLSGDVQERYVMFVVPLLFVGLVAGLLETRRPAIVLLLGAVVVATSIATTAFYVAPSSFWFLVSPGMTWFLEVIGPQLGNVAGWFGIQGPSRFALGGWAIALACLVLAAAIHLAGRRRALVSASITGLVLVYCVTATVHSFDRVVHGAPEYRGLGTGHVAGNDWVDRRVGRDTPVTLLTSQIGQLSESRAQWQDLEFWNRSVQSAYALSRPPTSWHAPEDAEVGPGGRIEARTAPRHVVVATNGVPVGLRGREVARSPDDRLALLDTGGGAWRVAWSVTGLSDDGWLPLERSATLTLPGTSRRCQDASLRFAAPRSLAERRSVRVAGAGVDVRAVVAAARSRTLRVKPCGTGPLRLRLTAVVPAGATAPGATLRLRSVSLEPA